MKYILGAIFALLFTGCWSNETATTKEAAFVEAQQSQYSKGQPVPAFNWSLERDQLIKLYKLRNRKVSTHAVWRSQMGQVLYDCPSIGYGLPFDLSLTNPTTLSYKRADTTVLGKVTLTGVVGQAEPNGVFASQNTNATWVMCVGAGGSIEPVYVEAMLNVYPFDLRVDYDTNRIHRIGTEAVNLK